MRGDRSPTFSNRLGVSPPLFLYSWKRSDEFEAFFWALVILKEEIGDSYTYADATEEDPQQKET